MAACLSIAIVKDILTMVVYVISCLINLFSDKTYLASLVTASIGPFSTCCLMALYNTNSDSPTES